MGSTMMARDPSFVAVGMDRAGMIDAELRAIEQRALAYWTTDPATRAAEILVRGRVVVAEVLPQCADSAPASHPLLLRAMPTCHSRITRVF